MIYANRASHVAQELKICLPAQERQEKGIQSQGQEDSPEGANDNSLQYSCLESSMERGAWWTTVHGIAKQLSACARAPAHTHSYANKEHPSK